MSRPLRDPSSRNGSVVGLIFALATTLACAKDARADEPETVTPRVSLRHDLWIDIPVTVGLGAAAFTWSALSVDVLPHECRWCDGEPGSVNAVDDFFRTAFVRRDTTPAKTLSDVMGYGVAPVAAIGFTALAAGADGRLDETPLDVVLTAEAATTSLALTELFKSVFQRERPYVHFTTDPDAHAALTSQSDTLVSFPSGHTGTTFAIAASAGTIATMRGYRLAPLVWIAGGLLGLTTGYLRMAADRHYFTDVVAGAAFGTGVGIAVPLIFHRPVDGEAPSSVTGWLHHATIATTPVPGGRVVSLGWGF